MAKEEKEVNKEVEIGLVRVSQETGLGMKLPSGEVIDLSNVDTGTAQVLEYLVQTISEIKKNVG